MKFRFLVSILTLMTIHTPDYAVVKAIYSIGEDEPKLIRLNLNSTPNITLLELKKEAAEQLGLPAEQIIICREANAGDVTCFYDIASTTRYSDWYVSGTVLWLKIIPQKKEKPSDINNKKEHEEKDCCENENKQKSL